MKTKLVKTLVGSSIASIITATLILNAQAGDQIKGAQLLMQSVQPVVPAAAQPANASKMDCPSCKSVPVEIVRIEKGHIRTVTYGEKHLCPTCTTTTVTSGTGKASKSVTNHTCSAPGSACAMTTGS